MFNTVSSHNQRSLWDTLGSLNCICMKWSEMKSLSRVRLFVTPWTEAHRAPLSLGFSRQEYWSGLAISFSRGTSRPRDQTQVSCIAGRRFNLWATREHVWNVSIYTLVFLIFPGGVSGKEPTCQCRRHKKCGFNPWVRKISWRRAQQPTPAFLSGESHGQRSLAV